MVHHDCTTEGAMGWCSTGDDLSHPSGSYKVCGETQHPMAHRTHSSLCHSRRGVRSWTGHHEWFGHHPRGTCQTPRRNFWIGRSHGGSDAEVRKCAVHHCILDSSEIDKTPGICDPQVGNSGSVNRETLPVRHSFVRSEANGKRGGSWESLIQTRG